MLIARSERWNRQPQHRAKAFRQHPLGRDLISYLHFPSQSDIVTDKKITLGSGGSILPTVNGLSLRGTGSAARASIQLDLSATQQVTVAYWQYWDSYANNDAMAMEFTASASGASSKGFYIDPNASGGAFQVAACQTAITSASFTRPSAAAWHHIVVTYDFTSATALAAYVDDVPQTLTGNTTGSGSNSFFANSTLYFLSRNNGSLFGTGNLLDVLIFKRVLTADEAVSLYRNHWQVLQPFGRKIFFGGSTGTTLTVADLAQAQALGAVTLTQHNSVAPAALAQAMTIGSPTLTQHNVVAPSPLGQAQTISGATVSAAYQLSVNGTAQSQTIEQPSLAQHNQLTPNQLDQTQTIGNAILTQHHSLSPNAVDQTQTIDNGNLTQHNSLAPNGLNQDQTIGNGSLTQHHQLSPSALSQLQQLGNVTLTGAGTLDAGDLLQAESLGSVTLTQHHQLTAADVAQLQAITNVTLTQSGTLNVAALAQGQSLELVTLAAKYTVAPNSIQQAQSIANVTLTPGQVMLAVASLTQAQALGVAALTQHNILVVDDITQAQLISGVSFLTAVGWLRGTVVIVSCLDGDIEIQPALTGSVTIN